MADDFISDLKAALPENARKALNNDTLSYMADLLNEPDMFDTYRENLLSYTTILGEGKYKLTQYIAAIKYCSYRMADNTIKVSFKRTFPDKVAQWEAEGVSEKDQSSYRSSYNKGKLVQAIMAQSMIPIYVLNQDAVQKAINTQLTLMNTSKSDKVRCDAANSLLTHLKAPETQHVAVEVNTGESSAIAALREQTAKLVEQQQAAIAGGFMSVRDLAEQPLTIEHED